MHVLEYYSTYLLFHSVINVRWLSVQKRGFPKVGFFCIIIDTGHPRLAPTSSREGPFHINETFFCPCLFISSLTEIRNHWVSVSSLKNDLKRGEIRLGVPVVTIIDVIKILFVA